MKLIGVSLKLIFSIIKMSVFDDAYQCEKAVMEKIISMPHQFLCGFVYFIENRMLQYLARRRYQNTSVTVSNQSFFCFYFSPWQERKTVRLQISHLIAQKLREYECPLIWRRKQLLIIIIMLKTCAPLQSVSHTNPYGVETSFSYFEMRKEMVEVGSRVEIKAQSIPSSTVQALEQREMVRVTT